MTIGGFNFLSGKNGTGLNIEDAARLATVSLHEADGIPGVERLSGQMPSGPQEYGRSPQSPKAGL